MGLALGEKNIDNIYLSMYEEIEEKIVYTFQCASGKLYVPTSGGVNGYSRGIPYSWYVSVNGGAATMYSGNSSNGGYITLSGYTSGTIYTITITPVTLDYGWAKAYGWFNVSYKGYFQECIYDLTYMGFADSETNTGDYFRFGEYDGCTNMTVPPEEFLPDTVTTIGNSFRGYQYRQCTGFNICPAECLPNSVTSIGTGFRQAQYSNCSIRQVMGWKDLQLPAPYDYRNQMYYNGFAYGGGIVAVGDVGTTSKSNTITGSYVEVAYVPNAYLNNYINSNNYPRTDITDTKFIGY